MSIPRQAACPAEAMTKLELPSALHSARSAPACASAATTPMCPKFAANSSAVSPVQGETVGLRCCVERCALI